MAKEIMVTSSIFFLALFGMPRNAHCCLQCEKEFTNKFNYYRKHLWWRSAWAGDLIYCQKFIDAWVKEIKETKVALPKQDLSSIARDVYNLMDQQYKLSHMGIGYFPKALQRIKRYQVERITEAVKKSAQICSEHCGTYRVDYIDCTNCDTRPVECGHKCPEGKMRGIIPVELNDTTTEKPSTQSESITPMVLLSIISAIVLLLGIMVGLYYCAKRRKKKQGKGQVPESSSDERNVNQKKSKQKQLKKWKKRKQRKKEIDYSTE
ncbi:izumo sperm-egg fusion protein 4-like [Leucoraja erinacea]|uniref:izumo sperm-egg fusion protein 4-like n=1 Tax=Leucoraja erinaceus TaxID=7782 RepID=UPI00245556D6|nr:izumo sperm-egg fusion protein 4-like [Leucoraja erinacea]